MAKYVIEASLESDDRLPGGRKVVHHGTIQLEDGDIAKLQAGESVDLSVALPNLTMRHLFLKVKSSV